MYLTGQGVRQDDAEAVKWFRIAAESENAEAWLLLGLAYSNGDGVPKDEAEAVKCFKMAAEQGEPAARPAFGFGSDDTDAGAVFNPEVNAILWLRMAADLGNSNAQARLGVLYANGKGVPKNEVEAVQWFRKAAERGEEVAQFHLANMYMRNKGVPKDDMESVRWYKRAAEQGHSKAQYELGRAHAKGVGVPKEDLLAYKWLLLAGTTDGEARQAIPAVEERLTPEQRASGQKLAREFRPVKESPPARQ